jgi:HEAT repeat protein
MAYQDIIIEKYVDRAVEEFDRNALAKVFLRRLFNEAPAQFLPAVMKHLRSNEDSNAHRFMATLALRQEEMIGYLSNPAVATGEVAQRLFRRFLAAEPSFDVRLARQLPDRSYANHAFALEGPRAIRALDILDQHSRGRRLLPILGHLPGADDSKVAAKATLFVGKRVQSPEWAAKLLARPDERLRANAVESIWGVNVPAAVDLLERCTQDRNNRVMGNALVGLHIVGHRSVDPELGALAKNGAPERRSTAAWAMGKIASSQWTPELTRLIKDEHPMVRSMALRSLMTIRRTEMAESDDTTLANAPQEVKQAAVELVSDVVQAGVAFAITVRPELASIPIPELKLDGSSFRMR